MPIDCREFLDHEFPRSTKNRSKVISDTAPRQRRDRPIGRQRGESQWSRGAERPSFAAFRVSFCTRRRGRMASQPLWGFFLLDAGCAPVKVRAELTIPGSKAPYCW